MATLKIEKVTALYIRIQKFQVGFANPYINFRNMQTCERGQVPNIMSECCWIHNYYIKAKSLPGKVSAAHVPMQGLPSMLCCYTGQTISSGARSLYQTCLISLVGAVNEQTSNKTGLSSLLIFFIQENVQQFNFSEAHHNNPHVIN